MTYENYLGFSREVLLEKMRQILPEKRLTHCLGVEKAARDLAKRYGADEEQAGLAGLLHDYAKKLSDQEFLDLKIGRASCRERGAVRVGGGAL